MKAEYGDGGDARKGPERRRAALRSEDMKANIHDRQSLARAYPPEAFAADAAQNQKQPANEILRGVSVTAAPDETGAFELQRAARHVGESETSEEEGAVFLTPYRPLGAVRETGAAGPGGPPPPRAPGHAALGVPDPREGYEAFLDDIIAAARRRGFRGERSPGPGDARLRGPRQ